MEEGRRSESEGSTLEEVNSGKEGLFRRKDRKGNSEQEGLLQASRVDLLRD